MGCILSTSREAKVIFTKLFHVRSFLYPFVFVSCFVVQGLSLEGEGAVGVSGWNLAVQSAAALELAVSCYAQGPAVNRDNQTPRKLPQKWKSLANTNKSTKKFCSQSLMGNQCFSDYVVKSWLWLSKFDRDGPWIMSLFLGVPRELWS